MKNRPAAVLLSAALICSLLLLNFTVVKLNDPALVSTVPQDEPSSAKPTMLVLLIRDARDSQDPETTACRYAIRQIIRMGEPLPALPALSGSASACPPAIVSVKSTLLPGVFVPRNAERIAAFLHDLSAAL